MCTSINNLRTKSKQKKSQLKMREVGHEEPKSVIWVMQLDLVTELQLI